MDISYKTSRQPISPAPVGKARVHALQHLGCTFKEGDDKVTKIATPTISHEQGEDIPTFMIPMEDKDGTSSSFANQLSDQR